MTLKELKQIAKFCRVNGILEYKCDGVELKFDSAKPQLKESKRQLKTEPIGKIPDTTGASPIPEVPWAKMTDEAIATWSAQQSPDESDV